ncbi:MAG: hypothetical protein LLG44_11875, partial [Chloroflexi bacterium]|nr:hypothetical protein [Chloroflexota bacterium]
DGNAVLLLPAAWQARMLAVFPDLPVMAQARADGLVGDEQELPRRAGEPAYLAWTAVSEPQGYMPAQSEVLANGAQLLGWKVARLDSGLRLSVMWRLTNAAEGTAYHQFNHLYSADGQTRLEVQDRALSSGAWRSGDTLITWADFALPEGQAQVYFDIGMYSYPSLERVRVLGAADPAAAIRLGPIAVP